MPSAGSTASRSSIAGDGPDLRGGTAARRRARSRRPRSLSRRARPRRRAHALPRGGRVAPHVVVGELPAYRRRGARRRDAGDRHRGRGRAGVGARRGERAARPGGDVDAVAAAIRRLVGEAGARERLAAATAPSVEHLQPENVYSRLEAILETLRGETSARALRRPRSFPLPARSHSRATIRGAVRRARLASARHRDRREALARSTIRPRASLLGRGARRTSLLPGAHPADRP